MIARWSWQRALFAYLLSAAACGVALGGLVSVRLSQRFLGDLLIASTARGAFAIDGTAALSWSDTLFQHVVNYALFLFTAVALALVAFVLRDPESRSPSSRRGHIISTWLLLVSAFSLGALSGAFVDRAVTKAQFGPSHVTASRVLEPFYAYDALYQRGSFALVGVLIIVWLVWVLSRQGMRSQRQTS